MMERQIANPMPIPLSFVVKKGSKILSGSFRPAPESRTSTKTVSGLGRLEQMKRFLGRSTTGSIASIPLRKQIENQLLQLHAIARHRRQILAQIRLHSDAPSRNLAIQEVEHLADDLIQVEVDCLKGCLLEERPDAPHYLSSFLTVANNPFGGFLRLGHPCRLGRQPPQAGLTVRYHGSQRLVNLVCDSGGKFANRSRLHRSRQSLLTTAQGFLHILTV